jgi:polar amino acid transport system substrate-binding protein
MHPMSCRKTCARPRLLLLLAAVMLAGCEWLGDLPKDPEKTLERVRGGTLRAGVIHAPPWVTTGEGEPAGVEADIVRQLAREFDAGIEWQYGAPDQMLKLLEQHELDLLIGGFEDASAVLRKVGRTRPYATAEWWVVARGAAPVTGIEGEDVRVEHGEAASLVKEAGGTPVYGSAGREPVLRAVPRVGFAGTPPPHRVMKLGTSSHVLAVPPGENAWTVAIDRSLGRMPAEHGAGAGL